MSVAKCAQHVVPNSVAICCIEMLRSFGWGFKLEEKLSGKSASEINMSCKSFVATSLAQLISRQHKKKFTRRSFYRSFIIIKLCKKSYYQTFLWIILGKQHPSVFCTSLRDLQDLPCQNLSQFHSCQGLSQKQLNAFV